MVAGRPAALRSARGSGSARARAGGEGRGVVLGVVAAAPRDRPGQRPRARPGRAEPVFGAALPVPAKTRVAGHVPGDRAVPAAPLPPGEPRARPEMLGPAAERV